MNDSQMLSLRTRIDPELSSNTEDNRDSNIMIDEPIDFESVSLLGSAVGSSENIENQSTTRYSSLSEPIVESNSDLDPNINPQQNDNFRFSSENNESEEFDIEDNLNLDTDFDVEDNETSDSFNSDPNSNLETELDDFERGSFVANANVADESTDDESMFTLGSTMGLSASTENPEIVVDPDTQGVSIVNENPTVSVLWDRAVNEAIAANPVGPTVAARTLALLHTAIYDAWSAYADTPISSTTGNDALQVDSTENTETNKIEAVSYAAYRTLTDLLPDQEPIFARVMQELGFGTDLSSIDPTTAAGIGTQAATLLLDARRFDGSNFLGDDPGGNGTPYSDTTNFEAINTPDNVRDIEQFTPENTPVNNDPLLPETEQIPLTPQFGNVDPFALESGDQFRPGAPEGFLVEGVDADVDLEAGTITLEDGTVEEISTDLVGTVINPGFIEQAEEIVDISANLTDEQKLIAEFWEDGPGTSFPPGNSLTFGQYVSARDGNSLDEDVELFFALGNSQLDSAIAAWDAKYFYNYTRPLRAIRELGKQGLIGEFNEELGGYAIEAYAGPGQGTQTILAEDFITYQGSETESSPAFPEYVSGHSTFSAAGAEVLQRFTGSDEFGGSVTFEPGDSRFEPGVTPGEDITLEWDTFSEFADESGISRLYGGIHWTQGDIEGRNLGRQVGSAAFEQAQFFINGGNSDNNNDLVTGSNENEPLTGEVENQILANGDNAQLDSASRNTDNTILTEPDFGSSEDLADNADTPLSTDATSDPFVRRDNLNQIVGDNTNNIDDVMFAPSDSATV